MTHEPMQKGDLPPLAMLRAFEAVGRMGSMRKAADDIGVSHNVVSYHIKNLEKWLGAALLERGPRGVNLTKEGRDFHAAVSVSFETISRAASRLRAPLRQKSIKIWCANGLASRWLTPRLSQIERNMPNVSIVVRPTERMPDFSCGEADLLIGYSPDENLPPRAIPSVPLRAFPVASPDFLKNFGEPLSVSDLTKFALIHEENHDQWANWFVAAGQDFRSSQLRGPRLWNAGLCIEAALAGQGIALGFSLIVQDLLDQRRLVELFDTQIELGRYYFLISPSSEADSVILRFIEWIRNEFETAVRT